MVEIIAIGLDIAKSVFQVSGIDKAGRVAVRRQLRRVEVLRFFCDLLPCLVAVPWGWKLSENVVGARAFEAGGIEPPYIGVGYAPDLMASTG